MKKAHTLTVGILAALVLSGCDPSQWQVEGALGPVITQSATATINARTAGVSVEVVSKGTARANGAWITATGLVDFAENEGKLTAKLPTATGTPTTAEIVFENSASAVKVGGRWVTLAQASLPLGVEVFANPQSISLLSNGIENAEALGTETVKGVATTRYRGTLNLRTVLASTTGARKAQLEHLVTTYGVSKVPFRVWIDGQKRLVRVRFEVPSSLTGASASPQPWDQPFFVIAELGNFGTPVDVTVPSVS